MKRQEGYYWVKHCKGASFEPLYYLGGMWNCGESYGETNFKTDEQMFEINETRIFTPDEVNIVVDAVKLLADVHQMD